MAYAKINLSLEVLGRLSDGYHSVTTVLQTVDLADHLTFDDATAISVKCSDLNLDGPRNLAWKAAQTLKELSGYSRGVRINIYKQIPQSMGLGGGSSDAATTLIALNELWGIGMSSQDLEQVGRRIGVDVPFFVRGGTVFGCGRGDELTSLRSLNSQHMVLVCPESLIDRKTERLYAMLGKEAYTRGQFTRALMNAINLDNFSEDCIYNAFQEVAFQCFPSLWVARGDMLRSGTGAVHLSGTGPGLYSLVPGERAGERIVSNLISKGYKAYIVRSVSNVSHLTIPPDGN